MFPSIKFVLNDQAPADKRETGTNTTKRADSRSHRKYSQNKA